MKPAILAFLASLALIAAPALQAQKEAAPAPRAAAETKVYRVTIFLRTKGTNIPAKFTAYLDEARARLVMPLFQKNQPRWVAEVDCELGAAVKKERFLLEISDVSNLELRSSERSPLAVHPIEILEVNLPLEIGPEIPVFKSPTLSIAIQFEEGS